ncbi:hypothetical protein [Acinetobacter pittii]|uniref:hypothetical protein n=1 Tax=Acinetobacter pittii TaxID=48296 RepID=UPI00300C2E70
MQQSRKDVLIAYGELDGIKTDDGKSKGFYEINGMTQYSPIPYEIVQTFKKISMRKANFNLIIEKDKDHYLLKNIKTYNIKKNIDLSKKTL